MDYPILVCPLDIGLLKQLWRATLRDNACGIRVSIYPILERRHERKWEWEWEELAEWTVVSWDFTS